MNYSRDGEHLSAEAALAVVATGWVANTSGLDLATPDVMVGDDVALFLDDEAAAAGLLFDLAPEIVIDPDNLDADERRLDAGDRFLHRRAEGVEVVAGKNDYRQQQSGQGKFSHGRVRTPQWQSELELRRGAVRRV